MESAIQKSLSEAIAAHDKGNLEESVSLYRAILSAEPLHPQANHNLGLIAVSASQTEVALPLFKTALEANQSVEQLWISYIDALIRLDKLDLASKHIEMANKAGFCGEKIQSFSQRLISPLERAAAGQFFKATDQHYLIFLAALHQNVYENYFEIGSRSGKSLMLSKSPSIAIDPFFQLEKDPIGEKDFCLMFQETSDTFFRKTLPKLSGLKCQLAFIDGMHLFEYALRDLINLARIASEEALFLFHDPLPWSFKMTTRDNKSLGVGEAWTGDIWKLVPILLEAGMTDNISVLSSAPSGILAVSNPDKKVIASLDKNYIEICAKWVDVELDQANLSALYAKDVLVKPEAYLSSLRQNGFGNIPGKAKKWVSQ